MGLRKGFLILGIFLLVTSVVAGVDLIAKDDASAILVLLDLVQFILALALLFSCFHFDENSEQFFRLMEVSCWIGVSYALMAGGSISALSYPQFGYIPNNIIITSIGLAGVLSIPFLCGISKINALRKEKRIGPES